MVVSPAPTSTDTPSAPSTPAALFSSWHLYGSWASSASASSCVTRAAAEGLPLLDDALHRLLERLEVLGGEGLGHVEVVVEAVRDERADAELRVGAQLLHRLRQHVGGRVAQHIEAVGLRRHHGLDCVAAADLAWRGRAVRRRRA